MKIDMEKTKALMEQVELWLKSSESEIRMDLTLCKTGTPDTFKVRYDATGSVCSSSCSRRMPTSATSHTRPC